MPAYLIVDFADIRDAPLPREAEYAELKAMRRQATTCHMILVDGLPDKEA